MPELYKLTEAERMEANELPDYMRAVLQDIVGQIDRERDDLFLIAYAPVMVKLYNELTAVADRMYEAAYYRPRSDT